MSRCCSGRRPMSVVAGLLLILFGGSTVGIVGGCGGRAAPEPTAPAPVAASGRATFAVRWPGPSRLLPFAANSVKVTVTRGNTLIGEQVLTRPAGGGVATATFDRVPIGSVLVHAVAYPNGDGSGIAQAQASTDIAVAAGQTTPVRLTLQSTISRIDITPTVTSLIAGQTATLTASPKNSDGETVLVTSSTLAWSSLTPGVATVDARGLVTAASAGTANIEVRETESSKTASVSIVVTAGTPASELVCDATTGHCYEAVSLTDQIRWEDAKTAAENRTHQGRAGHLITLTSVSETAWVASRLNLSNYWLGGYQDRTAPDYAEPDKGWRWVTGEPWSYTNWHSGEPNNAGPDEDRLQFWTIAPGQWNDIATNHPIDAPYGYVVEYEPAGNSTGDLIAYDGFDYPAGVVLNDLSGGTSLSTPWGEFGVSPSRSVIHTEGLVYPNLRTTGRAGRTTSGAPIGNNRLVANASTYVTNGTSVYYSVLVRPLDGPTSGYYGTAQGGIFVGHAGRNGNWVLEDQGGARIVDTGIPVTGGTTLLVLRVTYLSGNDRAEFWVNPVVGQPLPAPNAVREDRDVGEPEMAFGCNLRCLFDEYRVGRTWEAVAPPVP